MEKNVYKKTDKHILSVKCIHKEYLNKTSIMGATYIHCRSCESKWASMKDGILNIFLVKLT